MDELIKLVEQWSIDKNLDEQDPSRQMLKVVEEVGETAGALARGDQDELRDGIGDVIVTLIILAQQNDLDLYECLNTAYDEIKERKGKTVNGVFVKEDDLEDRLLTEEELNSGLQEILGNIEVRNVLAIDGIHTVADLLLLNPEDYRGLVGLNAYDVLKNNKYPVRNHIDNDVTKYILRKKVDISAYPFYIQIVGAL